MTVTDHLFLALDWLIVPCCPPLSPTQWCTWRWHSWRGPFSRPRPPAPPGGCRTSHQTAGWWSHSPTRILPDTMRQSLLKKNGIFAIVCDKHLSNLSLFVTNTCHICHSLWQTGGIFGTVVTNTWHIWHCLCQLQTEAEKPPTKQLADKVTPPPELSLLQWCAFCD